MKVKIASLCALLALGWSVAALAQLHEPPKKFYAGLGLGKAKARLDDSDSSGFGITSPSGKNETNTTYKFLGGYQFVKYLGLELAYVDFGKFAYKFTDPAFREGRTDYKTSSTALSAVGTIPLPRDFSLLAKLGVTYNKAKRSAFQGEFTVSPPLPEATSHKVSYAWGVGAQYEFSPTLAVRFLYEDYGKFGKAVTNFGSEETGRANIHMYTLDFIARF